MQKWTHISRPTVLCSQSLARGTPTGSEVSTSLSLAACLLRAAALSFPGQACIVAERVSSPAPHPKPLALAP